MKILSFPVTSHSKMTLVLRFLFVLFFGKKGWWVWCHFVTLTKDRGLGFAFSV